MNPLLDLNNLFTDAASVLTGGIFTDLTTAMLSGVGLMLLILGIHYLTLALRSIYSSDEESSNGVDDDVSDKNERGF